MKKNLPVILILVFFLTACSAVTTTPLAPTETPQLLESTSTGIPTLSPTATQTETPTPPIESLSVTQQSVNEFANAMQNAGVNVTKEQLLQQGIQIQTVTGVDGKQYEIATIYLDPDPTQQGETLEGDYPLMVKTGKGWEQATLKVLANMNEVKIGVYVGSYGVEQGWQKRNEIQKREFNAGLVSMEWKQVQTAKDVISFPDWLSQDLSICTSSDMTECYLHTVTWFQNTPDYLRSLPPEQVKAEVSAYIKAVVKRYKGKVNIYNIVNEAFYTYGGGDVLMQKLGKDYITFLFDEAAKEANAGDMLIYNDYNVLSGASSNAGERTQQIKEILQSLKDSAVIKDSKVIIGLGIQAHLLSHDNLTKEQLAEVIDGFGVPVIISEADVILSDNNSANRLQTQAETYKLLMDGVLISKNCKSVYILGTDDSASFFERQPSLPYFSSKADPLLFDDNFEKKASYYGILQSMFENLLKQ